MTELPEPVDDHLRQRASDADRERVAAVLRNATAEGRLTMGELDERLAALYATKTYGELVPFTRDLPVPAQPPVPEASAAAGAGAGVVGTPASRHAIAVMSGFRYKGDWVVPTSMTAFAFWGGGEIDLRYARFTGPETTIRCTAIMGGVSITVPEDITVRVDGVGIMGGFDRGGAGEGPPGAPVVRITGFAFWGGVDVRRKKRKQRPQIEG
ncbi:DUF1707 SHOCT-like domain-containing protein [Pseudonocardia acaciae]|uniref:DUF1707 SHOCT-like domain-containing protein n=1 Tax=Pseudonocardia acaciae TaxID=551276 RepID=UPI00048F19E9|nr:DUF1707 domain-containing protein [Pseudonocardia acaciae]